MKRWIYFTYGIANYLAFLAVYAYMAGFVGNFLVPKSIDTPSAGGLQAGLVDLGLLALFALQHSGMARPGFKRVWTRIVPEPIERSTYLLASNIVCIVLMWQWQGLTTVVWDVQQPVLRGLLWTLFAAGWLLVPTVSLMINHFDLFGMRQVWLHLRGLSYSYLPFRTPYLYGRVRHPLYLGWMLAFWATPTMSVGHMLFAATMTLYMVAAVQVEERDLIHVFDEKYRSYQRRVPMFIPKLRPIPESQTPNVTTEAKVGVH